MIDITGLKNMNAQAKPHKTQGDIAKIAGIKESRYSAILREKCTLTIKELNNLCMAFNCQPQDLIKYKED